MHLPLEILVFAEKRPRNKLFLSLISKKETMFKISYRDCSRRNGGKLYRFKAGNCTCQFLDFQKI